MRLSDLPPIIGNQVLPDTVYGCWHWMGKVEQSGKYPFRWVFGRATRVHIEVYQLAYGPIPEGYQVDHLCRNRLCINPAHLEACSPRENQLRKSWRYRVKREKCRNGHRLTKPIITAQGGRLCRQCQGPGGGK